MIVQIDTEIINDIIDSDSVTSGELGYLMRLIGLLDAHGGTELPYNSKASLYRALGVSRSIGRKSIETIEGLGLLYKSDGYYRLCPDLIVGGVQ